MSEGSRPRDEKVHRLIKGGLVSVSSRALRAFLGLLSSILFARGLGPFQYGLFATGLTTARAVSIAAPLGMSGAISRFASGGGRDEKRIANHAATFGYLSSVCIGVGLIFASEIVATAGFRQVDLIVVLQVGGVAAGVLGVVRVVASLSRFEFAAAPAATGQEIVPGVVAVLAGVVALNTNLNAAWALGFIALGATLGGIYLFSVVDRSLLRVRRPKTTVITPLLRFGLPAAASASLSFLMYRVDRLVLASIATPESVGVYAAASQMALVSAMAISATNSVLGPLLGSAFRDSSVAEQQTLFGTARVSVLVLTAPVFVLVLGAPAAVMVHLYGNAYSSGGSALQILGLGQLANVLVGSVGTLHMMSGAERKWVQLLLVGNAVVVAISHLLYIPLGIAGSAIASTTGIGLVNTIGFWRMRRLGSVPPLSTRWKLSAGTIPVVSAGLFGISELIGFRTVEFAVIAVTLALTTPILMWLIGADASQRGLLRASLGNLLSRGS